MQGKVEVRTEKLACGDTYSGEYTWARGGSYKGRWSQSYQHGRGVMKYANGDVYDGEWVLDQRVGKGACRYRNGEVFEGSWADDRWNGYGKLTHPSGDVYVGEWREGQRHGEGTMTYAKRVRRTPEQLEHEIAVRVEALTEQEHSSKSAVVTLLVDQAEQRQAEEAAAKAAEEAAAAEKDKGQGKAKKKSKAEKAREKAEKEQQEAAAKEALLRLRSELFATPVDELNARAAEGAIDPSITAELSDRSEVLRLLARCSLLASPAKELQDALAVLQEAQEDGDEAYAKAHPGAKPFREDAEAAIAAAKALEQVENRYEGQWEHGQRHGFGRITMTDGTYWEGEWSADKRHGVGSLYTYPEGTVEMAARWQAGALHSSGSAGAVYQYADYVHAVRAAHENVERVVQEAEAVEGGIGKAEKLLEKAQAIRAKQETAVRKAQAKGEDPPPNKNHKTDEEWEEVFADLAEGVEAAKGAFGDAAEAVAAAERQRDAEIADHGPRRKAWVTNFEEGKLHPVVPFENLPLI